MSAESVRKAVLEFLAPRLGGHDLDDHEDIFDLGFVNSLFAVQLLHFVEQEFDIALDPEDLEFTNFRTVAGIGRLVGRKRASVR